ncbi:alpha/beta fold hydrolase [Actinocrinis puniceicyclus]|uniref:Alpha/beta fold hydrolase n=1 Tax=Actinocrinis puniceicyclus TaxID=977794 RepID=A0A8J7WIB6_9ACTN|nr:alpha/beta hydrolase [Actinocrinis puniceicyclus]MBS2962788.1 alpha/beta fold hydrolase [Actinocrinis puniceicyclus]
MAQRLGFNRRAGQAALAAVFAVTLASCTDAGSRSLPVASIRDSTPNPSGAPSELINYYKQTISWSNCGGGFQCGSINVPLDYSRPNGTTIRIAIVRKPAADETHRIGSLLVNPGGPGGSGIAYARSPRVVSAAVAARYDLIGFDPRGVGQSTGVHCLNDSQMDAFLNLPPDPSSAGEVAQEASQAKTFAAQCEKNSAALLPYVGTVNAARDMDVLRGALGDKKLYYLGKSYGTYLGATYADEFPRNVGRLVLDGAIDPSLTADQLNLAQATAFDAALRQFAVDCAMHAGCPLGRDPDTAGLSRLKTWVDGLGAHPIRGDGTRMLTESLAMTGIAVAMYDQSWWPDLRVALTSAYSGDGATLLTMADAYNNRVNGHYQVNETEANFAVNCVDHPGEATGVTGIERDLPAYEKAAPFFGSMVAWSSLPCAYWPAAPDATPHPLRAVGAAPILVVGTNRDPATPYSWAQGLASQLKSATLLTMDGDGHTAYLRGSTCINNAVDTYLIYGNVPAEGTVCKQGR